MNFKINFKKVKNENKTPTKTRQKHYKKHLIRGIFSIFSASHTIPYLYDGENYRC